MAITDLKFLREQQGLAQPLGREITMPRDALVDGLMELEDGKLRVTLIKAVVKATQRATGLAYVC